MNGKTLEAICAFFEIIAIIFFLIFLVYTFYFIDKKSCEEKYNNSIYNFYGGCRIQYNGEYLPENLYIKAFEANLNINLK